MYIRFMGSTGKLGQGWHWTGRCMFFTGNGSNNCHLGTGFFVHKGIISSYCGSVC